MIARSGLPDPIVKDGCIDVRDAPGMGLEFNVNAARKYLPAMKTSSPDQTPSIEGCLYCSFERWNSSFLKVW
jgi:hypothetical protein